MRISFELDGIDRTFDVAPGERLRDLLRRHGIVSLRNGCDGQGSCGSCTVLMDGRIVNSCLVLAAQADGSRIRTIASQNEGRRLSVIQASALDAGMSQCGYCTPSFLVAIADLLGRHPRPSRDQVADALSGIFCRCTGYEQMFQAVDLASRRLEDPAFEAPLPVPPVEDLRVVGRPLRKVDGARLARGERAYVEDMAPPDCCHLRMLGSPHAHAYIKRIDVSAALALPGVVHVATWENCPDVWYGSAGQGFPEPSPYDRRMFGRKLRHVGDRVAAVVAETDEVARAALDLIEVDYEVLPPVLSIDDASRDGAPVVHGGALEFLSGSPGHVDVSALDERDGRIVYPFPIHADPKRNIAARVEGGIGDLATGFAQADVVIDRTYASSQVQCTPREPHVVLTRMEGDRLVIHASTQVPWHLRRIVARILSVPESRIRVIKERVGGGYGSKQDMVLEEVAAWCTWVTGRPVLYRFTREEEFIASRTRHVMRIRIRMGAKRDGRLTAIAMDLEANTGPYGGHCLTVPMNACSKSLPLLLCDHVRFTVTTWYSNIPPTGAYQGYGAPKGSFAMQLAAAEIAAELGMDHLEFIEKNRVREGSWLEILRCLGEGREGTPQKVLTCGLGPALARGSELIGWGSRGKDPDPDIRIGKGFAIVQQGSGLPGLDQANAAVMQNGDGTFVLLSGGTDLGTGLDTVCAKMAAEVLCCEIGSIAVLSGDTDATPFDVGAYASSGTAFSGGAAQNAARGMRERLLRAASEMLEEPTDQLALVFPSIVKGRAGQVTFEQIARRSQSGTGAGQLAAFGTFTTNKAAIPYGAHFAEVAVDVRTGQVEVRRYYALQDCGTAVNPELALGQMYGGALKTIGHSLWEEMVLDEQGRCCNANLGDYRVPMIVDLPRDFRAELVPTSDPFGPFGAKSVSEIACNGAAPAIASAIHDAVGVWIRDWPFSPEKVLRALGHDLGPAASRCLCHEPLSDRA